MKKNSGILLDNKVTGLANPSTTYVEIPVSEGVLGIFCRWYDATSAAAITLESTNEPVRDAAYNSVVAGDWATETLAITGPTAAAAGCSMTNAGNIGADRLRLKIVTTAVTKIRIRTNWKV